MKHPIPLVHLNFLKTNFPVGNQNSVGMKMEQKKLPMQMTDYDRRLLKINKITLFIDTTTAEKAES